MTIFVITAPSGAGKTSFVHEVQKLGLWEECVSHTTRPIRDGEISGKTYYFVEEGDFADSYQMGDFIESVEYNGNHYGISRKEIERVMRTDKHICIIAEYNGYEQIKEKYPDAVGIFLHMSKEDCLANMLVRGDGMEKSFERICLYDEEIKNRGEYDFVLRNVRDRQSDLVKVIKSIIAMYSKKIEPPQLRWF